MDMNQLNIQKVANGYIVREDKSRGDFLCRDLAVFNDVNDMCEWIKKNFTLGADKPQDTFMPKPGVTIGYAQDVPPINLCEQPFRPNMDHAVLDPAVRHPSQSHGGL